MKARLLCVLVGVASAVMLFLLFAPSPQSVEAVPTFHFMQIKNLECERGITIGCLGDCGTLKGIDCCSPGLYGSGGCLYCGP